MLSQLRLQWINVPDAYRQLFFSSTIIRDYFEESREISFIVERGRLYINGIQRNNYNLSKMAQIVAEFDSINKGLSQEDDEFSKISKRELEEMVARLEAPVIDDNYKDKAIARGASVLPGVASGPVSISGMIIKRDDGNILASKFAGGDGKATLGDNDFFCKVCGRRFRSY